MKSYQSINGIKLLSILIIMLFAINHLLSQNATIYLANASFEELPQAAKVPKGWKDCGFPNETPPDIHSGDETFKAINNSKENRPQPYNRRGMYFSVNKKPRHGKTYLGMVTRDNDTWERVSQLLISPIKNNICYTFSISLCRSENYLSRSRLTGKNVNYVKPIRLVLWGGNEHCSKVEILGETELITNTKWKIYDFEFKPNQEHSYLTVEAFYKRPGLIPYNGNVLIDNASPIMPINCESGEKIEIQDEISPSSEIVLTMSSEISDNDLIKELNIAAQKVLALDKKLKITINSISEKVGKQKRREVRTMLFYRELRNNQFEINLNIEK